MGARRNTKSGSVYRRGDGYWAAAVDVGRVDGERIRLVDYAATKAEAEGLLPKLIESANYGVSPEAFKLTLEHYARRWLNEVIRRRLRYSTFLTTQTTVSVIVRYLGRAKLSSLSPIVVQGFYAHLMRDGYSIQARHRVHKTLKAILKKAVTWELIRRNPCDHVAVPKCPRREMLYWTPDEVVRFLHEARTDRLFALYALALNGMRRGELLALRWSDVDWEGATITVARNVGRVKGGWDLTKLKTKKSRRVIDLPTWVVKALRQHRRKMQGEGNVDDLIFVGKRGRMFVPSCLLDDSFKPLVEKAEVPRIRFHDLRHTAATLLMAEDVPLEVISHRLGHSKLSTTFEVYMHALPHLQREAADKLDEYTASLGLTVPVLAPVQYL